MFNQDDIVELPNGSIAQVEEQIGELVNLHYLGTHIQFHETAQNLRRLGSEKRMADPPINLKQLITERNQEAVELMTALLSKRRGKEPDLLLLLSRAKSDDEFRAILIDKGLLNLEKEGGEEENAYEDSDS